jgi:23S rRNA (adenine2503-C2)-methyltransferase
MDLNELEGVIASMGEKAFRAKQIFQWLHEKGVSSYDEMTTLPKGLREKLKEEYTLNTLTTERVRVSDIDGTRKYLFRLWDGNLIESVWMKYRHGNSVCISSQSGCRMGCLFCASTLDGLSRSLSPSEMLDQIYQIQKDSQERVSNIVVMGMGEPLDNYENLLKFIRLLSDADGLAISRRNIVVSTCGLVPQMRRLAKEGLPVTLALSLHAPNDAIRKTLMPVAKSYPIQEVLEACQYYFENTGRRVTLEYSLIRGVNDQEPHARELAARIRHMGFHVNLIPVNPVKERGLYEPQQKEIANFKNMLEKYGIHVTIRREMGRDIEGACGQLRRSYDGREGNTY